MKGVPATIKDVAAAAGVSTATVSRVLSDSPLVVEATRIKVQKAIGALNYMPNATATSLRKLTTERILVMVPNIANPFFSPIMQSVEDAASREGYSVLIGDTRERDEGSNQYANMLPRQIVDGLILLALPLLPSLEPWVNAQTRLAPIVSGLRLKPGERISGVSIDDFAASSEAMDHLYGLGHQHVGILAGPTQYDVVHERLRGAIAQAKKRGFSKQLVIEHGEFSMEAGVATAAKLLARQPRPTALFCMSDASAIGACHYAHRSGLKVPSDLSVIGFDDIQAAPYMNPPLSTINVPLRDIGRAVVRLLVGILQGKITKRVREILPHQLVLRGSTTNASGGFLNSHHT